MNQNSFVPIITAFKTSPDRGRGMARDMRVRWAFEEVGQPYDVQLVSFEEMKQPAYLALQPFGQIPAYKEGELLLFESGAIVLHIANKRPGLLPTEEKARARAISWMFSALSTMESAIVSREEFVLLERDKPWYSERLLLVDKRVVDRLSQLSKHLADADWLDGDFSAADLLMVTVLRRVQNSRLLSEFPNLGAYIARGESRPAYQRAFAAQLSVFKALSSKSDL